MASKPRSQWSPAYAKRIARAEAAGKSRQQARGHKAQEHVHRKARETALGGLTSGQKGQINKFAGLQALRAYLTEDAVAAYQARMREWAAKAGYERFRQLRALQQGRVKQMARDLADGSYQIEEGALADWVDEYDVPDESWLYYH